MAMVINHNIPALTTYNTVNRTNAALEKSIQKLSTGLRINSAADDAAGLAISEKMRSQINGMDRAVANAQDGISMIQTAEGALNETHSILQRMRELSVQASNDTMTSQDRGYIQMEIDQLREEITRIGNTTQFNKKKLLNGDAAVLWSSSDLSTKAIVNGGLRSVDQFGQKVVTEGNYKIKIKANPGTGEVQKSDIFKIKHKDVIVNKFANKSAGIDDVTGSNLPAGSYSMVAKTAGNAEVVRTGEYGFSSLSTRKEVKSVFTSATSLAAGDTITLKDSNGNVLVNAYEIKTTDFTGTNGTAGSGELGKLLKKLGDQAATNAKAYGYTIDNKTADTDTDFTFDVFQGGGKEAPKILFEVKAANAAVKVDATNPEPETTAVKFDDVFTLTPASDPAFTDNASVLFEVTSVDTTNNLVGLRATANILAKDGTTSVRTSDIALSYSTASGADNKVDLLKDIGLTGYADKDIQLEIADPKKLLALTESTKFVYNFKGKGATATDVGVQIKTLQDTTWPDGWEGNPLRRDDTKDLDAAVNLDASSLAGKNVTVTNYYLNEKTGEVQEGSITLSTNSNFSKDNAKDGMTLGSFDMTYVGKVATGDVKLRDLDKFWTSEGVFMLDDGKNITLTQGDGKQASVTLYGTDTLNDVATKLNNAIANSAAKGGLGQGQYVDDASQFVNFVTSPMGNTAESVKGTFVIRTVVPGEQGAITFSGDENIINAFSLNQLKEATESTYTVSVSDAHSDKIIANNVKVTGNILKGVVHENVDVEFDPLTGVSAKWNADKMDFVYDGSEKETILHLSDNTTAFQIGANQGEDMNIHIGDMRSGALGIDRVNVTNRDAASRSITILDNAIDKVSTQRAKLGAYQNRLEHTVNNLNTASENITAAESRIRDTDMAKEMMNFTKLQIMLQAGTSMLAQANQLPQNVMALVR